jgi:hypothetical protein
MGFASRLMSVDCQLLRAASKPVYPDDAWRMARRAMPSLDAAAVA